MIKLVYRITMLAVLAMVASGCRGPAYNLPPMQHLKAPGPGIDGPGPGVLAMSSPGWDEGIVDGGEMAACYAEPCNTPSVQVMFAKPNGMHVHWDVSGSGTFESTPLIVPGRTNFNQVGLYRLKLTHIPAHEGMELYPTVEIGPTTPRTHAFLAHNTVPVQLTVDDFNQVSAGNFVTKVIYLPDPNFQHLAVAGVETLVSTRLDPGIDPIVEADRRGTILAVVRVGNKDIEMPGMQNEASMGYMSTLGTTGPSVGYAGGAGNSGAPPTGLIAGVNMPMYGATMTGTPIGIPGPPHMPLGGPAGLRKHVIHNHTRTYIPEPSHKIGIHVKQHPGLTYPAPKTQAFIHQYNHPNCAHCVGSGCEHCVGSRCAHCVGRGCKHCIGSGAK